ncbi:MAG: hypothetical protein GWN12_12875, partial [Thermoplasmata archaeon]|nr:hypothetical protein [Thermoplasmata archaeon]NIS12918.1 hypothetical protein [Thermoplasmata archaeon]NIT78239.1 hypothetical protein [Thermoplasmata archaeon]NIW89636.1 hypothetical protein [Thermoplasmata archaeon]NIY04609.1 hypothetical protein [Thermoplasmata archaeon]
MISKKAGTIYSISIGNARAVFEGDHYKLYTLCYDGSRSIGCFKLVPKGLDGRYTSRMLDAGGPVRLINVTWNEGFSVVGNMTFQLRYGNSTSAMTAWTDLSAGTELANVTARYYQYRVDLDVPRDWMRASIQWVNISYEVPVDKIEAIIDGSAPIPVDFNFTSWWLNVSLDDGNHTVIIRITDATGSTVDIRLDPRVDLYPPRGYVLIEEG